MKKIKLKHFVATSLAIGTILFFSAWGGQGHFKISSEVANSFPTELLSIFNWTDTLATHASDADDRKQWDPNEAVRHYIDIDNYTGFLEDGRIPQTFDSAVAIYGNNFVMTNGTLPFTILNCYDSLKTNFEQENWNKVAFFASDLGHYVADGHMPLHITRNYNGQYTNQTGVHARYESHLINLFISQIPYTTPEIAYIENVNQYVFNFIYSNYIYVDSVLIDDAAAYAYAGNYNSAEYFNTYWQASQEYTTYLFNEATKSIAQMIYTAWIDAGSPNPPVGIPNTNLLNSTQTVDIYPNPAKTFFEISFQNSQLKNQNILITIYNSNGKIVEKKSCTISDNTILKFDVESYLQGIYFCEIKTETQKIIKKIIVL